MTGWHAYRVGAPYAPGRTSWPEGAEYNYRGGGHELRLFYARPTAREVRDVSRGLAEFAVTPGEHLRWLLFRFGDQPWSATPYSWHLVPPEQRTLPSAVGPTDHPLLMVFLVDAETGILRAMRAVTFPPAFGRALHDAIHAQASRPWAGREAYDREVDAADAPVSREPAEQRLLARAVAPCAGGRDGGPAGRHAT